MPDMPMGFVSGYLGAGQAYADMEGKQLENKIRQFGLEQAIDQSKRDSELRMELANIEARNPAINGFPAGGMAVGTGQDGMQFGGELVTPKVSDLALNEYQQSLMKARAAARLGNASANEKYAKDASAALQRATTAQAEERKDEMERWNTILQWATASQDADSLNQMYDTAVAKYGNEAVKAFKDMGFERSPEDGKLMWSVGNAKRVEFLREASLKEVDRVKREQKEADQKRMEAEAEDRRLHRRMLEQQAAEAAEARREGLEIRREAAREAKQAAADRNSRIVTNQVQTHLDKDPIYSNFAKYQQAKDLGDQVILQLQDPKGFENFNASDARALASAYSNIAEGFRSRQGGKYQMQDVKAFNGALQRLQAWTQSLGRGTPTFSESTARDVSNTITQLYDIANKNALIASFEGKDMADARKGDANAIRLKGNLARAKQMGYAKVEMKGDKKYLVIGSGDTAARFEIKPEEE